MSKNLQVCRGTSRSVSRKNNVCPRRTKCVHEERSVSMQDSAVDGEKGAFRLALLLVHLPPNDPPSSLSPFLSLPLSPSLPPFLSLSPSLSLSSSLYIPLSVSPSLPPSASAGLAAGTPAGSRTRHLQDEVCPRRMQCVQEPTSVSEKDKVCPWRTSQRTKCVQEHLDVCLGRTKCVHQGHHEERNVPMKDSAGNGEKGAFRLALLLVHLPRPAHSSLSLSL